MYEVDQQRIDTEDKISGELFITGCTDAAFGYRPQYADEDYLLGYLEGIKQLPCDGSKKILYHAP